MNKEQLIVALDESGILAEYLEEFPEGDEDSDDDAGGYGEMVAGIAAAAVGLLLAECFQSLLVRDDGDYLALRFGPIPLFHKRFLYSQMTGVEPNRSTFWDGWGIHYMPGRGWIFNLWGYDCVKLTMGRKTVRIGTDDVAGLVAFLRTKIKEVHP